MDKEPGGLQFMGSQKSWDTTEQLSLSHLGVLVTQSCPTLCDPMDCSLPGSSVPGILQARILEWVAMPFCRGILPAQGSNQGLSNCRQILYHLNSLPFFTLITPLFIPYP